MLTCFIGIGFGAYSAVDFALVMDVLPEEKDKAKDLAVWHQVSVFVNVWVKSLRISHTVSHIFL